MTMTPYDTSKPSAVVRANLSPKSRRKKVLAADAAEFQVGTEEYIQFVLVQTGQRVSVELNVVQGDEFSGIPFDVPNRSLTTIDIERLDIFIEGLTNILNAAAAAGLVRV